MSGDQARRRGSATEPGPPDPAWVRDEVGRYLADVDRFGLRGKHHPTPSSALQVIYRRGAAQKEQIVAEVSRQTGQTA